MIEIVKNGQVKKLKTGFSWTVFFFGWIALAIRKQYIPSVITFVSFGLAGFYFMFKANQLLLEQMQEEGWEVMSK